MQVAMAANPGAMPDLTADPATLQAQAAEQVAYAAFVQRVHRDGVEASAVVRRLAPTGQTDLGGGAAVEMVVSVRIGEGELADMQVRQHLLPAQLEALRPGTEVVVKYDRQAPTQAVLVRW